jgi:hypothetical protein
VVKWPRTCQHRPPVKARAVAVVKAIIPSALVVLEKRKEKKRGAVLEVGNIYPSCSSGVYAAP